MGAEAVTAQSFFRVIPVSFPILSARGAPIRASACHEGVRILGKICRTRQKRKALQSRKAMKCGSYEQYFSPFFDLIRGFASPLAGRALPRVFFISIKASRGSLSLALWLPLCLPVCRSPSTMPNAPHRRCLYIFRVNVCSHIAWLNFILFNYKYFHNSLKMSNFEVSKGE